MSKVNDPDYLRERQYKDSRNLDARIALHARYSSSKVGGWESVFDHYAFGPDARVLEIGCGTGMMWVSNKARIPHGWQITLTDFSAGMLAQTQRNLSEAGIAERFAFQQADAQDLPFPARSFDAVIANFMLYHVPDRHRALAEIKRVLREQGALYAVTVGREHMAEIHRLGLAFERASGLHSGEWGRALGTEGFFTVESAEAELRQHFSSLRVIHFRSSLRVTEVEPLVDYILSTAPDPAKQRQTLTEFITQEMRAQNGVIEIGKHTALFVAQA